MGNKIISEKGCKLENKSNIELNTFLKPTSTTTRNKEDTNLSNNIG